MDKGNSNVDMPTSDHQKNKTDIKTENISSMLANFKDQQPPVMASEKTANYQCGLCQQRFYEPHELKKHMKSDHLKSKKRKNASDNKHNKIEFENDTTSEDITVMPDIVDPNEMLEEEEGNSDFFLANAKCGLCHETFDDPKDLKKHLCQFLEYAPALKKKKGKKIVDPFNPKPDRKRPGPKPKIKITDCQMCGKKFCNSSNLYTHIRNIHQGEKKHGCNLCGKKFPQKIHLQRHFQKVHEGQTNPSTKIEEGNQEDEDSKDFNTTNSCDNVVVKVEPSDVLVSTKSESGKKYVIIYVFSSIFRLPELKKHTSKIQFREKMLKIKCKFSFLVHF